MPKNYRRCGLRLFLLLSLSSSLNFCVNRQPEPPGSVSNGNQTPIKEGGQGKGNLSLATIARPETDWSNEAKAADKAFRHRNFKAAEAATQKFLDKGLTSASAKEKDAISFIRASSFLRLKKYAEAEEESRALLVKRQKSGESAESLMAAEQLAAQALIGQRDYEGAEAIITERLKSNPDALEFRALAAGIYTKERKYPEAVEQYSELVALEKAANPNSPRLIRSLRLLGESQMRIDDFAAALKTLQSARNFYGENKRKEDTEYMVITCSLARAALEMGEQQIMREAVSELLNKDLPVGKREATILAKNYTILAKRMSKVDEKDLAKELRSKVRELKSGNAEEENEERLENDAHS